MPMKTYLTGKYAKQVLYVNVRMSIKISSFKLQAKRKMCECLQSFI